MAKPGWYVIQVQAGNEPEIARTIERVCAEKSEELAPDSLVVECFSPRYVTRTKYHGEWQDVSRPLLPGYVIAVTPTPKELAAVLRSIPRMTRILSIGDDFVPLHDEEKVWIEESTRQGDRVVPLSLAVVEGDSFVVKEGPLKGREGLISKVNRHKCLATIEFRIAGKTVRTIVGLAIMPRG